MEDIIKQDKRGKSAKLRGRLLPDGAPKDVLLVVIACSKLTASSSHFVMSLLR